MTNKFTQTPDPQDPNALRWVSPRSDEATLAPKDEAAKDEEDDDLDEDEDEDDFDEDEDEDEDADEKEEGDETA
ncbi:MAG: hypothetical protein ABI634_10520 [Acidobacteriota bacterium]